MDREKRLEDEALERFAKETKKKVNNELVIWHRDDDESIAVSTDGSVGQTEAFECNCAPSPRHLEAWITKKFLMTMRCKPPVFTEANDNMPVQINLNDPSLPVTKT